MERLIAEAHRKITRTKGKEYAPDHNEIQKEIDIKVQTIQNKVSDLLLSLDPNNLPEDQFIGGRTLSASKDAIRISHLMKAYPGATPERIARLHLENCLERDYWYMFEINND